MLNELQERWCEDGRWDFSGLSALFPNCTLKRSPEVPPQADAGWIGEAGPGPSYLDPGSVGSESEFTNRNTTFLTWNLLHVARMIKDAGGIPAHGNQRSAWDAGCRFDYPNPEHR